MPFIVQKGEALRLTTISNAVITVVANCVIRYNDGSFDKQKHEFTTVGTRAVEDSLSSWQASQDGEVENATVVFRGTEPSRGGTHVQFGSAVGGGGETWRTLFCQGYLYVGTILTLGFFGEQGEGRGQIRTITGTNPAAGAEISETVPTNARWKLLSFTAVLVADGNASNRFANLVIDNGTTANRRAGPMRQGVAQTASQTRTHIWSIGHGPMSRDADNITDTDSILVGYFMGDVGLLPPAARIRTITTGLLAGDNYAAPIFQVEEWVTQFS